MSDGIEDTSISYEVWGSKGERWFFKKPEGFDEDKCDSISQALGFKYQRSLFSNSEDGVEILSSFNPGARAWLLEYVDDFSASFQFVVFSQTRYFDCLNAFFEMGCKSRKLQLLHKQEIC